MGFFDKLSSFASKVGEYQANRLDNAARFGYVGDRHLSESQREMARKKANDIRSRLYRDDD